jgi:riboflavin kinase
MPGKHIEGFTTPERTFGPVKCFSAKLRGVKVAIVMPSRTHLTDVVELIAPKNLRKKLGLKDGDRVKLEVRV